MSENYFIRFCGKDYKVSDNALDRASFSIGTVHDGGDEKGYWQTKTPQERVQAIEVMRRIVYGYDPDTERLSRFFEITELKK